MISYMAKDRDCPSISVAPFDAELEYYICTNYAELHKMSRVLWRCAGPKQPGLAYDSDGNS